MANEIIERVKQAIHDNIQAALPDGVTVDYHYAAIAAMYAMREPTDEMIEASNRLDRISGGILKVPIPEHSWQAMIDAALKD